MKIFLFYVLFVFLSSASTQEKAEAVSDLIDSKEEELLVEDDDKQILSEKKDKQSKKSHEIIENDEELILDDSEEYLIAPATVAKPINSVSNSTDTSKTSSVAADSVTQDKKVAADSAYDQTETVNTLPKPQHLVVRAKDAKIENTKLINFAHNLNQYRSPKLAMLFSFLLPGSGQLYARHKLKTAVFGAAELAIIGTGTALAVKGSKEMKKAHKFADEHYSVENFKSYYFDNFKPGVPDTVHNSFFGNGNLTVDQFLQMAQKKDNEFYRNIQGNDNPFVRGWIDVTPTFLPGGLTLPQESGYKSYHPDTAYLVYSIGTDSTKARFGFSKLQEEFESKFSRANNFYDISQKVFFLLLLDRIVSAVDAGITAKAYNDEMLGKQSMWQRINIEQKQVNSGWDTYSGYALVFRF
jgi:hypothetical protein